MWAKFAPFCGCDSNLRADSHPRLEIAATPTGGAFVAAALEESARVEPVEGDPPPARMIDDYSSFFAQKGSAGAPSMLYDIEAGRPTEGDHILGDLVRRADWLSTEVPILRAALRNLQIYRGAERNGTPHRKSCYCAQQHHAHVKQFAISKAHSRSSLPDPSTDFSADQRIEAAPPMSAQSTCREFPLPKWPTDESSARGPAQMTLSCSSAAISAADNPSQSP